MKKRCRLIPFWSLNSKLEQDELISQIRQMKSDGIDGFILHARGGLKTEYMGEEWLSLMRACAEEAERLGMEAWLYDENGWPSGFAGGELLKNENDRDRYFTYSFGIFDAKATAVYDVSGNALRKVEKGTRDDYLNVYEHIGVATADICKSDTVDKFISLTHEKYANYFGKDFSRLIAGFFTDEPQQYRWHTPFSSAMKEYYRKNYGENIYDKIGLLFVEKEGYREFRYKYYKGMHTLMLENFSKKIYEWCSFHKVKLTGHYIDEKTLTGQMWACGGIMPFYEYMDVPGIDWLGRNLGTSIPAIQLTSVAEQTGKERVLTESFAMVGWDVTPRELKTIADFQFMEGVNVLCHHLFPYSEEGQRKRDYPNHYAKINPWVSAAFKNFNEYFRRFGDFVSDAEKVVRVALLQPITSAYLYFKREDKASGYGIAELEKSYLQVAEWLDKNKIPFHIVDETILKKHGKINGANLIVGRKTYDYLVLPLTYNLDKSTDDLIKEYTKNGGKLLLADATPTFREGVEYDFSYLKSTVSKDELIRVVGLAVKGEFLRVREYKKKGERYFAILNESDEEQTAEVITDKVRSLERLNFYENTIESGLPTKFSLKGKELKVMRCSGNPAASVKNNARILFEPPYSVKNISPNYLTLDKCSFSKDGINYTEPHTVMGIFQQLLSDRYRGKAYLRFLFECKRIPAEIKLITENNNLLYVKVNGNLVDFDDRWERERNFLKGNISKFVHNGVNIVDVVIDFYEKDEVYYALFGDGVTEGLKNCIVYDTTIENIYLEGDFGVYSKSLRSPDNKIAISDGDFYIDERKTVICNPIFDGELFFIGEASFAKKVYLLEKNVSLRISGRFQVVDVFVNENFVKSLMFDDEVDISPFVVCGYNEIVVRYYTGCRNLLGPFHCKPEREPKSVSPDSFERNGTYKDFRSDREADDYSFVIWGR